jgi:hypothetical protein
MPCPAGLCGWGVQATQQTAHLRLGQRRGVLPIWVLPGVPSWAPAIFPDPPRPPGEGGLDAAGKPHCLCRGQLPAGHPQPCLTLCLSILHFSFLLFALNPYLKNECRICK